MNIFWYGIDRLAEISSILLNIFFLYRIFEAKCSPKKQTIAAIVFIVFRMCYYALNLGFRPYYTVLTVIAYSYVVFASKFRYYFLWAVFAVVIDGIVDAAVASIYLLLPHASIEAIRTLGADRAVIIIVTRSLLFMSYYFVSKNVDKYNKSSTSRFTMLLLIPVGCWELLKVLFGHINWMSKITAQTMLFENSIALLLIIVSATMLYHCIAADEKELARSKLQLKMQEVTQNHIEQVETLYSELSMVQHSLSHHLSAILGYANDNMYEELKKYIIKITSADNMVTVYINHPILDALISEKMKLAIEKEIKFDANFILPNAFPIDDVDLCILVGNILDNAFTASMHSASSRYVNLSARIVNSYWAIACRNSVQNQGDFISFHNMDSTKDMPYLHGIGTSQIQMIAEKTGGFVSFKHKGYEFSTLVMLKMPEGQLLPDDQEVME